jgi:asparagine synthase (glutamine-hydrolysing)
MCGISGIATFDESGVSQSALRPMMDAIRHRGPDDQGCFRDPGGRAALGHRRLSIIDLASGHQPVFNEDGLVSIVFNGEIYNYLELRGELERKGHRFRTKSDTEVIVHLYEQEGSECVRRLRGMFAFAIWDGRMNELLVARDRVGKKPAYYAVVDGTLYFASEIQALYDVPGISRELDYEALDLYLTYSYVPSPRSIYRNIRKLPPAHTLRFNATGLTMQRYWQPSYQPKTVLVYDEAKRELIRLLSDAVRLRLVSEVPLGAFLSGGVDSAAIVALMSRLSDRPVKTFSIGFRDEAFNELPYARTVAQRYNTDHREFMVEPDKLDVLGDLVRHYGEPYGDSSAVPTWHLSRVTREHVTVALNGDGGDELFGGYGWYDAVHRLNRMATPANRTLARYGNRLGSPLLPRRVRRALALIELDEKQRFQAIRSFLDARERASLYDEEFRRHLTRRAEDYLRELYDESLRSDYDRAFAADFLSYLPEDLLVKVDRASMAHGLECRSPFLDQELVEFASSLPPHWKINDRGMKRILKDAVEDWFPAGFLERPKMGFSVPIGKWFRGELRPFVEAKLLNGPLDDLRLFKRPALRNMLDEHFSGARDHQSQIWNVLMLALWCEEYGVTR